MLPNEKSEKSLPPTESISETTISKREYGRIILSAAIVFLLTCAVVTYVYYRPKKTDFSNAITQSNLGIDQKPLQDYVVANVATGQNDDKVKEAIFLLSHRFFDNGGDIYEIYDFVNSHNEVAFLREAEKIEPEAFQLIKDKKVARYDTPSTLALLSYFEVADKKGYANLSMLGTAANKYAELAYDYRRYSTTFGSSTSKMDQKESLAISHVNKSYTFSQHADEMIKKYTKGTYNLKSMETLGLIDDDLLVGLNQLASAQYFYIGMGDTIQTKILPGDMFAYNSDFARRKVPRLYNFTNYLWAVSNIYGGSLNTLSVAPPLTLVIDYGRANKDNPRPAGSMSRIINSKTNNEKSVFSYENTKLLAKTYKPFKEWLTETGWTEKDFK